MQIKVEKLRNTLALLQPAVPRKPTLAVLSNVLVKDGKVIANDLETAVAVTLPEAEGTFLMNHRVVTDLLKFVPGYEVLTIEPNKKSVKLTWDGGGASYPVPEPQDYPGVPLGEVKAEGSINGDMLVDALNFALPYCAADEKRPVLCGVSLYLGNPVVVAGADGFRLSYQSLNASFPLEKTETIIVPPGTVRILEHIWRKSPAPAAMAESLVKQITGARNVTLSLRGADTLEARFGNIQLVCKLIQGNPPDHLLLLGGFKEPTKVSFLGPELYNAVRRLRTIARDSNGIVRLVWTDTSMTVSAQSSDVGETSTDILVLPGASPGRIAINIAYLQEYLAGKDGIVTMGKTEETSPAIFHYGATPVVVIMPMTVSWGDEKPAEPGSQSEAAEETAGGSPSDEVEEPSEESPGEAEVDEAPPADVEEQPETHEPEPVEKQKRRGRRKKS